MINTRIAAITPSLTLGITSLAKKMVKEGQDVCNFAAGEPDFDTPQHIKDAAVAALEAGKTKYAPIAGLPELRSAIADKLMADNALKYSADDVVVSNGGKHSLFNIVMAICGEGDEVIIPSPFWLSYPEMVGVAGGKSVYVAGNEANGFKITPDDLAAAITPRSRALIMNSPSNPIGIVYTKDELQALAEIAVANDMYIISDEIYEKLIYEGTVHTSTGSLSSAIFAKTITMNGFSKAYAMTGWRLGYFAGPQEVVKAASALQSHSTSGPNTFAQYGAVAALTGPDCIGEMLAAFDERRSYLHGRLEAMNGVSCVRPMGAFYALPNISESGLGSVEFADRLLKDMQVAVIPGAAFGADANVRLSYACSMEEIEKGADRIEKFVATL